MFIADGRRPNEKRERAARRYDRAREKYINYLATDLTKPYPYFVEYGPFEGPTQWAKISNKEDDERLRLRLDSEHYCIHHTIGRLSMARFWLNGWARRCGRDLSISL